MMLELSHIGNLIMATMEWWGVGKITDGESQKVVKRAGRYSPKAE